MHGGSGSTDEEIALAVTNGVCKMNIDTDTQWAYWDGLRAYELKHRPYLQAQIGNPDGADKPNKKYYDPRKFVRAAEETMCKRVMVAFDKLSTTGKLGNSYIGVLQKAPTPKAWSFFSGESPAAPDLAVLGGVAAAAALVGLVIGKSLK